MKTVYGIALALVIVGGVNWGLVGWLDYNLVDSLFGTGSMIARTVYALVGVSALYVLVAWFMPSAKGEA